MHFAVVITLSAFLIFLVQPLIAKQILPWFGGSAAVWTTCMVFFQTALLAGYAYADWAPRRFGVQRHARIHAVLAALSLIALPIAISALWKPADGAVPILRSWDCLPRRSGCLTSCSQRRARWCRHGSRERIRSRSVPVVCAVEHGVAGGAACYPFLLEPR
jgi:hypothetical protein